MADNAKQGDAPAKAAASKPKRHILTTEERIAKAEQDLAVLRDKAQGKDRKRLAEIDDKTKSLTSKRDELNSQLKALADERAIVAQRLAPATDEKPKG